MCKHTSATILTGTLHACLMGVSLSEMLCCFLLFTLHILCEQLFPRGSEEFVIKHIYHRVTNPNVILWALVVPQLKFSPGQHRFTFSTQNARLTQISTWKRSSFLTPRWLQAKKASVKMPEMMTSRARGPRKAGNRLASSHFGRWTWWIWCRGKYH